MSITTNTKEAVEKMFEAGVHYGYSKTKRHPSVSPYIYGNKDSVEIFNLEKTQEALEAAKEFVREVAGQGKQILFVASKFEARKALEQAAEAVGQPYVAARWIGGTLTNFEQIQKRTNRLAELKSKKERGELAKYTKKEQLLLSREAEALEEKFGGIADMNKRPGALFVVDPKKEAIAIREAQAEGIPVIALANTDCNIMNITYPIPGNDANRSSIEFFVREIAAAYEEGKRQAKPADANDKNQTTNRK